MLIVSIVFNIQIHGSEDAEGKVRKSRRSVAVTDGDAFSCVEKIKVECIALTFTSFISIEAFKSKTKIDKGMENSSVLSLLGFSVKQWIVL